MNIIVTCDRTKLVRCIALSSQTVSYSDWNPALQLPPINKPPRYHAFFILPKQKLSQSLSYQKNPAL